MSGAVCVDVISREPAEVQATADEPETRRQIRTPPSGADRAFRSIVLAAAVSVLIIMGLIGLFLLLRSTDALGRAGWSFLTEYQWLPNANTVGIAGVLTGTILIAAVALVTSSKAACVTRLTDCGFRHRTVHRGVR